MKLKDLFNEKLPKANSRYTMWDSEKCQYFKAAMFRDTTKPCRCFAVRFGGRQVPIGMNLDFTTCELIYDLIVDAVGEK